MTSLKRYQRFLVVLVPYVLAHIYHLSELLSSPIQYPSLVLSAVTGTLDPAKTLKILNPYVSIIILGLYAVGDSAWTVYNFNDCKEASVEVRGGTGGKRQQ